MQWESFYIESRRNTLAVLQSSERERWRKTKQLILKPNWLFCQSERRDSVARTVDQNTFQPKGFTRLTAGIIALTRPVRHLARRKKGEEVTIVLACLLACKSGVRVQPATRHYFLLVTTQTAAAGETTLVLRFIAGGQVVQVQFSLIGHIFRRERERETEDVLRVADGRTDWMHEEEEKEETESMGRERRRRNRMTIIRDRVTFPVSQCSKQKQTRQRRGAMAQLLCCAVSLLKELLWRQSLLGDSDRGAGRNKHSTPKIVVTHTMSANKKCDLPLWLIGKIDPCLFIFFFAFCPSYGPAG